MFEALLLGVGTVLGAAVASLVTGHYTKSVKVLELEAQRLAKERDLAQNDMAIALKCAELKHQQLVAVQDWTVRSAGTAAPVELWDPLQTVVEYLNGIKEFRRTGSWSKAQSSHYSEAKD